MLKKHFIYTEARSGSNFLVDLFNQHPQLVNYGEVLGDWTKPHQIYRTITKKLPDKAYLNFIFSSKIFYYLSQFYYAYQNYRQKKLIQFKWHHQVVSVGVKDFHHTLLKYHLLDFFSDHPELYIIYLYRENLLKQHLSLELMRKTQIVSSERTQDGKVVTQTKKAKIQVDLAEVLAVLDNAEKEVKQREDILSRVPGDRLLSIAYEDLFASPEAQADFRQRAFDFLGVEAIAVTSRQRKLSSDDLRDLVENYDELYQGLINTPYAKYLN
jgi:LPS sulfotransferase NodH